MEILREIAESKQASFLAVLKSFGKKCSPGMLSFPMEGWTLALDFPNRGDITDRLFQRLDRIVCDAKGRLYPAKDSKMSAEMFYESYSQYEEFKSFVDPKFSSSFWRRVNS